MFSGARSGGGGGGGGATRANYTKCADLNTRLWRGRPQKKTMQMRDLVHTLIKSLPPPTKRRNLLTSNPLPSCFHSAFTSRGFYNINMQVSFDFVARLEGGITAPLARHFAAYYLGLVSLKKKKKIRLPALEVPFFLFFFFKLFPHYCGS